MIGTATQTISKGAVEHAVEQAVGHAKGAAGELSERVMDAEVVQELRRKARKELKKAAKQVEQAKKAAKKSAKSARKSRSRRGPRPVVLLVTVGFIAFAVYMVQRRRNQALPDVAPDPFGEAVEEERRAGAFGQRPAATPGA